MYDPQTNVRSAHITRRKVGVLVKQEMKWNKTKRNRIWKPNHAQTVKQPTSWLASTHHWSL